MARRSPGMNLRKTKAPISHCVLTALLSLFLVLLSAACVNKEVSKNRQLSPISLKFREKLQVFKNQVRFPGATAAFALPEGPFSSVAVGNSDEENRIEMKPLDRLPAGSVGKTFVAALAILLAQEGRFSLDDKIEKWLGDEDWFPRLPNHEDITIRTLLNHRSGLKDHAFESQEFARDLGKMMSTDPDEAIPPEQLVSYVLDVPPLFKVGTDFHYSDTNYILVGIIIEKATRSSYYEELKKRILTRFGLNNTLPADKRELPGIVPGYLDPHGPFGLSIKKTVQDGRLIFNPLTEWTGGGLISTSEDLARWAKLLYEGKLSTKPYLEEMLDFGGFPYGLGVGVRVTELGKAYGHSGYFPGYITAMGYFPDHKIAVAIQFNRDYEVGDPPSQLVELAKVIIEGLKPRTQ
jgi:D-alanyl-D-alanine carboxypeptidase